MFMIVGYSEKAIWILFTRIEVFLKKLDICGDSHDPYEWSCKSLF